MIVLISGASSGIGRALAQHYLSQGETVVAIARHAGALAELDAESSGRLYAFARDVTDESAMTAVVTEVEQHLGPISLAIASAGIAEDEAAPDLDPATLRRTLATNVSGALNILAPVAARMRPRGEGQIVAISSLAAMLALPHMTAYCASKAALNIAMDGLHFLLRGSGVRVTTICPGFIATNMTEGRIQPIWCMQLGWALPRILRAIECRRRFCRFPQWQYVLLRVLGLLPDALRMRGLRSGAAMVLQAKSDAALHQPGVPA
jgi:NAD(P)-dependent dehydrogenase (short-subunit alcohol dehydrogenase family)